MLFHEDDVKQDEATERKTLPPRRLGPWCFCRPPYSRFLNAPPQFAASAAALPST